MLEYIQNRLKEKSTWRGIVTSVAGAIGFTLSPQLTMAVVAGGVAFGGVVDVLIPESFTLADIF